MNRKYNIFTLKNPSSFLTQHIKQKALSLGFSSCGFSAVRKLVEHESFLETWLEKKFQGEMSYMDRNREMRLNPSLLIDGAKTIISFTYNYYPTEFQSKESYQISKYAYGNDYHKLLKDKLHTLLHDLQQIDSTISGRAFVDSAPILERAWAVESGLGWIGKHSLLIIPQKGTYFFLCELIINKELEYDYPFKKNYCGNCTKCIDACPAKAIVQDRVIDARKCISYLTIEKKGEIEQNDYTPSPYIYGCDICQDVCPWNSFSKPQTEIEMNQTLLNLSKNDFERLSLEQFNDLTIQSTMKRVGFNKLKNSIEIVENNNK